MKIEDYTAEGFGSARHEGYVLFIPGTIAGETVEALVVKAGKRYGYGKALQIMEKSPARREPLCPLGQRCGGCAFWHLSYEEELRLKAEGVRSKLLRIAGLTPPMEPICGAEEQTGYRNKAQYPIRMVGGRPQGGFYAAGSHGVVAGGPCAIQPVLFNRILQWMLAYMEDRNLTAYEEAGCTGLVRHLYLRRGEATGEVMACLVVNSRTFLGRQAFAAAITAAFPEIRTVAVNYNDRNTNVVLGPRTEILAGPGYIEDVLLEKRFRIAPQAFYQVNRKQTEVLYRKVRELAALSGRERVLDLYCGIGTIGLTLAGGCRALTGVEIVPEAIENAKENARLNGIGNARFICADAQAAAARFAADGERFDLILVDPPRRGCDAAALAAILQMRPEKLIYVSCNAATLARDLKQLQEGGYQVRRVVPVDLFPRTPHVETVVMLSHKKPDSVINVKVEFGEGEGKVPLDNSAKRAAAYKPKERVTYKMIKEYIEAKYGFKVHTAYIAEVKRDLGLPMYDAPNAVEELKQPRKHPTVEKVEAIKDALKHFEVI